ncbi:MAG: hypothetical protein WC132_04560 [Methanomethylophilus sp.]|jgi:hypothetical protein
MEGMTGTTEVAEERVESQEVVEETREVVSPVETEEVVEGATAEEAEEEKKPEPRRKTAQERIDELTRKRREAEREAAYWKAQAEQSKLSGPPVQENFETFDEFVTAAIDYRDRQKAIEARKADEDLRLKASVQVFNENAAELKAQNPDFDEVVERPVFTDTMRRMLLGMDNGPKVAYHIGKNATIAGKFANLSPEAQIYEIVKLEQSLTLAEKTKKTTSAPPPIDPVGTPSATEKDPSSMSIAEWMEWDRQRHLAKLEQKIKGG